jgi:Lrp/AsnC family transcriptional regulator
VDYLLRVVVPDMQAYDIFYKRLIAVAPLKNVTSRFAMERVKATTVLPIPGQNLAGEPRKGSGHAGDRIKRRSERGSRE